MHAVSPPTGRSDDSAHAGVVFIDAAVADRETLIAGLDSGLEIVLLAAGESGLAQMAAALEGRSDLDAVHVISHGAPGMLQLGSDLVTAATLAESGAELAAIGAAMGETGDLLLWGCEAGAGEAGAALVASLAGATGADVAASSDLTGAARLGGDWHLEVELGEIELGFDANEAFADYAALFALPISSNQTTNYDGLGLADTAIIANGTVIDDVSYDGWRFNGLGGETGVYAHEGSLTNDVNTTGTRFYTSDSSNFKFTSIDYVIDTAGNPANATVTFYGFRNGVQVESQGFNAADTSSGTWTLNWGSVDEVKMVANTNWIFMDNLKVGAFVPSNTAPAISISNTNLAYTEGNAATQIDSAGTVNDADGDADWNGGTLEIQITSNAEAGDRISIVDSDGDGTAITISGTNIFANGVDIGDLSTSGGIVTGGTKLTITFDPDATNANVQEVLQSIRYDSTTHDPGTSNRVVTFTATDSSTASASDTRTIQMTAVNDEPSLTASASNPTFTEGGAAASLFTGTDLDTVEAGQNVTGLSFTVTNVVNGSNERINIDGTTIVLTHGTNGSTAGNSLNYSVMVIGTTATVTLTGGNMSVAAAETMVDNMSYQNNSNAPSTSNRVVTLTSVQDSGGTANGGDNTASLAIASTVTVVNAPPALSAVDLEAGSDTGKAADDEVTRDTSPTVSFTAENGATVEIDWGDGAGFVKVANGTGAVQRETPGTAYATDGEKTITVRAKDAGGQTSEKTVKVTIDTAGPALTAPDLATASDTGPDTGDNVTSDTSPSVAFTAEAGATVMIDWGDGAGFVAAGTGTGARQEVTKPTAYVTDGDRKIDLRATDAAGNETRTALTITVDSAPPSLTAPDLDAGSDTGADDSDDIGTDATPTISYTAEAGATVEIDWGDGAGFVAAPKGTGAVQAVTLATPYATPATREIKVRATDAAGLQTLQMLEYRFSAPPTEIALSATSVAQDAATGTEVGTLSATDPEGEAVTISLLDDSGGIFAIRDGALVIASATALFDSGGGDRVVALRATDIAGASLDREFTVSVVSVGGTPEDDRLVLGDGGREVDAGAGDDVVTPGGGTDVVTLGTGADTYEADLPDMRGDTITDFTAEDRIVIRGTGDGLRGLMKWPTVTAEGAVLEFDSDGDGTVDTSVTLRGDFSGGDFMAVTRDGSTTVTFESYLPALGDTVALAEDRINGIVNGDFLTGDGVTDFRVRLDDRLSSASSENLLGVYEVDGAGNIVNARLLFDAAADPSAVTEIVDVPAGHTLGFFILQAGSGGSLPDTLSTTTGLAFQNPIGAAGNVADGAGLSLLADGVALDARVFHSYGPGLNTDGLTHVVSGVNPGGESLVIGFEDREGGGDRDYQDVVFTVSTSDAAIPFLGERQTSDPGDAVGIADQDILTGDGATGFRVTLADALAGAVHSHAVGVYEVDAAGAIHDARILFGDTGGADAPVELTDVEAGRQLGFFIVRRDAGTALGPESVLRFEDGGGGSPEVSDGSGLALSADGSTVDALIFHSFDAGLNSDGLVHTLSGGRLGDRSAVLGFEDLEGPGNHDFQDVVLTVDTFALS